MLMTDPAQLQDFYAAKRLWQGIPSIERSRGGRLFATFYSGGTAEQEGNYALLIQSDDDGHTWSEPIAVAYDGEQARCYDPCLWVDPLGRLWFWWSRAPEHMIYATICEQPDAKALTWGEVFAIDGDVMMNKPTVLKNGDWLFPIAVWGEGVYVSYRLRTLRRERGSFVFRSVDHGRTLRRLGGAQIPNRSFDEHMIVEKNDGVLWMLVRTRAGPLAESHSYDGGHTWTAGRVGTIASPSSRFFIRRLPSGNLLLINHHDFRGRNNLKAMISRDDGQTWEGFLLLDERDNVAYPDATLGADGFIYAIYDRERGGFKANLDQVYSAAREVLMAKFTEEDVLAGKLVDPASRLKCLVSRLGAYEGEMVPFGDYARYAPQECARRLARIEDEEDLIHTIFANFGDCSLSLSAADCAALDECVERIELGAGEREANVLALLTLLRGAHQGDRAGMAGRMLDYLDAHLGEKLCARTMARALHISRHYMCHLFKEATGTTMSGYCLQKRLEKAKHLLRTTEAPMQAVSDACGFSDASHFARCFRQREFMTPSAYRKIYTA